MCPRAVVRWFVLVNPGRSLSVALCAISQVALKESFEFIMNECSEDVRFTFLYMHKNVVGRLTLHLPWPT